MVLLVSGFLVVFSADCQLRLTLNISLKVFENHHAKIVQYKFQFKYECSYNVLFFQLDGTRLMEHALDCHGLTKSFKQYFLDGIKTH